MKDSVAANRLHSSIDLLIEGVDGFYATATFNAPPPLPATPELVPDALGRAALSRSNLCSRA